MTTWTHGIAKSGRNVVRNIQLSLSLVILAVNLIPASAYADFTSGEIITRTYVTQDGVVRFGVETPPASTCSNYGVHFSFNSTTVPGGKAMLSYLLSAKLAQKAIDVWFAASSEAGNNETSGCNSSTIAQVSILGITGAVN